MQYLAAEQHKHLWNEWVSEWTNQEGILLGVGRCLPIGYGSGKIWELTGSLEQCWGTMETHCGFPKGRARGDQTTSSHSCKTRQAMTWKRRMGGNETKPYCAEWGKSQNSSDWLRPWALRIQKAAKRVTSPSVTTKGCTRSTWNLATRGRDHDPLWGKIA